MTLDPYGIRRTLSPPGALPQRAEKLDALLPMGEDELEIAVSSLNIDAASFRQIEKAEAGDPEQIRSHILAIVQSRGKMHNPVTGSGGMLLGTVKAIGPKHPAARTLKVGDRIATLVSLSLTPLRIDRIVALHPEIERVDIEGTAFLFATGIYAKMPTDLPEALALAAFDVCGAPALTARFVTPGMKVLVIGAGKSGALVAAQAKQSGAERVVACDISRDALERLRAAGLVDRIAALDATKPVEMLAMAERESDGALFDLVVNCASVRETEVGAILACRQRGQVLFFSMATSFTAAALASEGVGKDVTLSIGNGYAEGHAELTLGLLRSQPRLRALFEERYL